MNKFSQGLAMKEMLVMLGMIAMLAAVAIPSHIDHERKKQVANDHKEVVMLMSKFSLCVQDNSSHCDRLLITEDVSVRSVEDSIILEKNIDLYRSEKIETIRYSGKLSGEKIKWTSQSSFCGLKQYENSKRVCVDYEF